MREASAAPAWVREWGAAGLGCALADTVFNPLEVLKTRRQAVGNEGGAGANSGVAELARAAVREKGVVRGLWEPGLAATWARGMSYTGFRIGMYPKVRDALPGDSLGGRLAAGALTGGVGSAVFAPIDLVRIRQQGPRPFPSTAGAFAAVANEHGLAGLWRGTSASVLRAALLSGSQLATYDTAKRVLKQRGAFAEEGVALHLTSSFLSGLVAQAVTMPADTLKTRIMSQVGAEGGGGSTLAALRDVLRAGGPAALYRGFLPALARQGPVMVVQMPLVEQLRRLVGLDYM